MIEIASKEDSGVTYVTIEGEVDASSSIHLDQSLGEAVESSHKILIDCSGLDYISSAGLGVFMSYISVLEEKAIKLVLFGLSDKVFHVFQILGLDQLLRIEKTEDEAKAVVNGGI